MNASVSGPALPVVARMELDRGQAAILALTCVVGGFLPVAAGYLPAGAPRLAGGIVVTGALLGLALLARRRSGWRQYWEVPLAFFGMALFVLADRYEPGFLATQVLHSPPTAGDPLASTISGTVLVAINELVLTVVAVLVVVWMSGSSWRSLYLRRGRFGWAYVVGILGFLAFYVLTYRVLSHSRFMPVHGTFDLNRYLALTPALLAAVAANGLLEELMFRGLLMSRLNLVFGPLLATVVQAVVFASWHVGVTYTSSAAAFIALVVFPLGLFAGYLTRSSGSILPSALFHAGADMPIYLEFLSFAS
jgi:uncharacterized protein